MKIGVLGGSFDPIHKGHIKLGGAALRQLGLDKVYFVLSPKTPFKIQDAMWPVEDRLRMLQTALKPHKGFQTARWELKRRGPTYTIDTLKNFKKLHPSAEIYLIMGSDVFRTFRRWKNPEGILRLATVVVGRRNGSIKAPIPPRFRGHVLFLKGRFPAFSSTELRMRLEKGYLRSALPLSVWRMLSGERS